MTPADVRDRLTHALRLDLIGPDPGEPQISEILNIAPSRWYLTGFLVPWNAPVSQKQLRPIRAVLIRSSTNIAERAAEFVRSPAFGSRATGVLGALFRRLGEAQESDILSYLLFDGEFARQLIEHGRADARAHHEELCTLFESVLSENEAARAAP